MKLQKPAKARHKKKLKPLSRLDRIEKALVTLICWSDHLGELAARDLLAILRPVKYKGDE